MSHEILICINNTSCHNSRVQANTTYFAVTLTIAVAIILVNGLVILLVFYRRKLLKDLSNKIVFSLVISDLLTGFVMVFHIITMNHPNLAYPKESADYCYRVFVDIGTLWLQLVTMANLCFIIAERYIALIYPYTIKKHINQDTVIIAIKVIWISAFLYPCIQLFWLYHVLDGKFSEKEDLYLAKADSTFSSISIIIFVMLPIIILFFMFLKMLQEIKKLPSMDVATKRKEETRVVIIFGTMYFMFVLFTLPYFITRLIWDIHFIENFNVPNEVTQTTYLLKSLPPLINPFIYVLNKPDFRRELYNKKDSMNKYLVSKTPLTRTASKTSTVSRRPSGDVVSHTLMQQDSNNNQNVPTMLLQIQKQDVNLNTLL